MAAWLSDAEPGPQAVIDAPAAQPEQQPDVTEEPAPEVTEEPVEEPETAAVGSAVTYYDPGTGAEKTARNVTRVTADVTAWTQGWYEVWGAPTLERVSVQGNVNLILSHGTILTVTGGITVADGGSLTIWGSDENYNDDGELTVTGADRYCAGIGTGRGGSNVKITVNGGTITAASRGVAGVGGGTVTINGGVVTATGGYKGVGIGAGINDASATVNINGGVVNATGGNSSAGIGGDAYSKSTVTINGGVIKATAGRNGAAGIGSGYGSRRSIFNTTGGPSSATVIINAGAVNAAGGGGGAAIGGGNYGTGGAVTINGGTVKATARRTSAPGPDTAKPRCSSTAA